MRKQKEKRRCLFFLFEKIYFAEKYVLTKYWDLNDKIKENLRKTFIFCNNNKEG